MRTLGNILWLILAGVWSFLAWVVVGAVLCVTIIGIPFGVQCIKLGVFSLWPFGRTVVRGPQTGGQVFGNIVWLVLAGVWIAIGYMVAALLLFATIIGIPFGLQAVKLAGLAVWPFGAHITTAGEGSAFVMTTGSTPIATADSGDLIRPIPKTTATPQLPPLDDASSAPPGAGMRACAPARRRERRSRGSAVP
jgi:uncharacterized membrane protein YccF (DUF307 family)